MKKYSCKFNLLSLLFIFLSCATGVSQKNSSRSYYQEDLSEYRPTYSKDTVKKEVVTSAVSTDETLTPTRDVTKALNQKLSKIGENAPDKAKGYRVRVYTGSSRQEATEVKEQLQMITNEKVYIEFKTPNFRVKVGDAIDRLEANYLLGMLHNDFPNAVIVPDEININNQPN